MVSYKVREAALAAAAFVGISIGPSVGCEIRAEATPPTSPTPLLPRGASADLVSDERPTLRSSGVKSFLKVDVNDLSQVEPELKMLRDLNAVVRRMDREAGELYERAVVKTYIVPSIRRGYEYLRIPLDEVPTRPSSYTLRPQALPEGQIEPAHYVLIESALFEPQRRAELLAHVTHSLSHVMLIQRELEREPGMAVSEVDVLDVSVSLLRRIIENFSVLGLDQTIDREALVVELSRERWWLENLKRPYMDGVRETQI